MDQRYLIRRMQAAQKECAEVREAEGSGLEKLLWCLDKVTQSPASNFLAHKARPRFLPLSRLALELAVEVRVEHPNDKALIATLRRMETALGGCSVDYTPDVRRSLQEIRRELHACLVRQSEAVSAESAEVGGHPPLSAPGPSVEGLTAEEIAAAIVLREPEITNAELARRVGRDRSTVGRWDAVKRAREASAREVRPGWKKDGRADAAD